MNSATQSKTSEVANGDARSLSTATTRTLRARTSRSSAVSAFMSKTSARHSRRVSTMIGKDACRAATWSRSWLR